MRCSQVVTIPERNKDQHNTSEDEIRRKYELTACSLSHLGPTNKVSLESLFQPGMKQSLPTSLETLYLNKVIRKNLF